MGRPSRLLKGFEKFAIPNITLYWVGFQALCMVLIWGKPDFAQELVFDTRLVVQGEWWRAISFVFMPETLNPIFAFFALYLLWLMGSALEANWGTARYNLFLWIGVVMSLGVAFLPMLVGLPGGVGTNTYLLSTVFLAFATLYPDFVIQLFFILPIRIKWLALVTWILLGVAFLVDDWTGKAMLVGSLANYFVFFWREILERLKFGRKQMARQVRRMGAMGPETVPSAMHTCKVCRRTEKSHPQLEFRYCSLCGNTCYCLEHLRGHPCGQPVNSPV